METTLYIESGDTIKGTIACYGDADYFKFTMPGKGRITYSLTDLDNNEYITFYDSNGDIKYTANAFTNDSTLVHTVKDFSAGTYYVKVDFYTGKYSLNVSIDNFVTNNGTAYWYTVEGTDAILYPTQAGNTYYYDPQTGLMAKGYVIIDGTLYHFDEITGALD